MLLGRHTECATLDRLLESARSGQSSVLVVRGEPGVGKTAMLEYAVAAAPEMQTAQAVGVESEMELPFAALHQLCAPLLDRLEGLPAAQREALETAFGLSDGEAPDRFAVGLAVLGLLSEVARTRPLLCLVDNAHSLDHASAEVLGFVGRRLYAESVALVFATSESIPNLRELSELHVRGLGNAEAHRLLTSAVSGPLDEQLRERIVDETRGNPLALLELPRGQSPAQLAGGFGLSARWPLRGRIEQSFHQRIDELPADARELTLIAAAEPIGDPTLVLRAAARLGIDGDAAAAVGEAGLLEIGAQVRFRHPLVRSAAYRAASLADRRRVHGALAEVTDPVLDPDRRAWHRAQATAGPDETVAAELERSAGRAQARGGLAAAAAFLERSVELTMEPGHRAQRALSAAQAKHQAGAPDAALALAASAEAGPLDDLQRAQAKLLRAQIAFAVDRGKEAPGLLLAAARQLEPLDVRLARDTYLDALSAATFVGHLSSDVGVVEIARAARAAPPAPQPARPADLLLDGLALLITDGHAAGAGTLKRALSAFRTGRASRDEELRWLWLAGHAALDLWDDETWFVLATRHVEMARQAGALAVLPIALNTRTGVHLSAGEFTAAAALLEEVKSVAEATETHFPPYVGLALAAFRGQEAQASALFEHALREVVPRGEGIGLTISHWAMAVLYNGLGRYGEALDAAQRAGEHPEELRFSMRALVELIEAAARTGHAERATEALQRLSETTRAGGTELALGTEARSRALVSEGETAERLYREAIERLGRTRVRTALARAHLLFGEWLRRENRRRDARQQLRIAHEMFSAMGMEAYGERAARELLATGETARKRTVRTRGDLTAQEAQIAGLARDGLSNSEIAARLFISPRTVEHHLSSVFGKLDIRSRHEL